MLLLSSTVGLAGLILWAGQTVDALMMPNASVVLARREGTAVRPLRGLGVPRYHRKRHITAWDIMALLDYHNHIRANVYPPAANMEYMVWDELLAKTAEAWAGQCIWDHGPSHLMRFVGQNLSVLSGRYTSILDLVKLWANERWDYSFPAPGDCTPRCPWYCSGPVCTHYTQMVWASSNRLGCAIHTCDSINVWGNTWYQAVYLVCNYAMKGNWMGEAPYKMGMPCSACPPSYGGSCYNNMCFHGLNSNKFLI
uniref:R3H domain containing like n=1 Tax=Chinchilla lanigera TaxID=34839 RepID=A0A8C2YTV9_CHILA